MSDDTHIVWKKHPLIEDYVEASAPAGMTIREVIAVESDDFAVMLDDEVVPPELWATTRTQSGQRLFICGVPRGDGAQKLLMVAGVIAASIFAPGLGQAIAGKFGGALLGSEALWTGTIMASAALTMQALVKPPVIE